MFRSARSNPRGLLLLLGITALTPRAFSAERPLTAHLDWTAPKASRCPNGAAIVRAVETRLNRTIFVHSSRADLFLSVVLAQKGAMWSAKLELFDSQRSTLGTRELESKSGDCAALNDVLPVVIALLVDASQDFVRLELPEPTYVPAAKPQTPPNRMPRLGPEMPHEAPWRLGWTAQAEGLYGLLPGAAPGAKLVGFVEPSSHHLTIELWLGAFSSIASNDALHLSLVHAGAALCPSLWRHTVHWALCGGTGVGRLQSFGRGFDVNQGNTNLHVDLRAATELDIPIARPWFARLAAGALFPLIRQRFVGEIEPQARTVLHHPAVIVPLVAIGIGVGYE